jgi:hypothetical protein
MDRLELRQTLITEIMKMSAPKLVRMERKPSIDELEQSINASEDGRTGGFSINPDGTVSKKTPHTVDALDPRDPRHGGVFT